MSESESVSESEKEPAERAAVAVAVARIRSAARAATGNLTSIRPPARSKRTYLPALGLACVQDTRWCSLLFSLWLSLSPCCIDIKSLERLTLSSEMGSMNPSMPDCLDAGAATAAVARATTRGFIGVGF